MSLPTWLARLFVPASPSADVLNIPPALFKKWMQEVADEQREKARTQ